MKTNTFKMHEGIDETHQPTLNERNQTQSPYSGDFFRKQFKNRLDKSLR